MRYCFPNKFKDSDEIISCISRDNEINPASILRFLFILNIAFTLFNLVCTKNLLLIKSVSETI